MTFIICWGFAKLQILKIWKWPYLLIWVEYLEYFDEKLHTHCSPRDCQMSFGIGRGFAERQILKKVNLALSLEPFGIFW